MDFGFYRKRLLDSVDSGVCVCVREGEREYVCVCERERERMCVCQRER